MHRIPLIALVAIPPLICAVVGLGHPMRLTTETAAHWQAMHVALIPLFPLIGFAPWLIARRVDRRLALAAAVFGYGFATFYTALDILAGVAAGTVVLAGQPDATASIYAIARVLAWVGVASLVLGALVAGLAAGRRSPWGIAGAGITAMGAFLVQPGHIYFPLGTLAMLLLAGGFTVLAIAVTSEAPSRAAPGSVPAPS